MAYSKIKRIAIVIIILLASAYVVMDGGQVDPATECLIKAERFIKQHKSRQAMAQIDLAIKIDPFRNNTYDSAAMIMKSDIAQVERIYAQGFKLDPDNAGLLNGLGYLYADSGTNLNKALELTRKAVALQPDNGMFVDSLGWAQYKSGHYAAAITTLQKAVILEPNIAELRYHLGAAYAKNGRFYEAEIELQKAVTLNPHLTLAVNLRNKLRK